MNYCRSHFKTLLAALALTTSIPGMAGATEGSFALGYGPVQRGQGGAGVAMMQDAMSSAINPAAPATLGREFDMGIEFFMPLRGYEGAGTFFVTPETSGPAATYSLSRTWPTTGRSMTHRR